MSFMDKLKKKAEELDLEAKAKHLQETAAHAAKQAREKAGDFAAENREKIDGYVESATAKIDEKTDGKYHDKVVKVKDQVAKGVDKVAEGHTAGPTTATGAAAAAGAADVTPGAPYPVDPEAPTAVDPTTDATATTPDETGFDAAAGDLPAPTQESLTDTTLEDTVLGLDHPPATPGTPGHGDAPQPEDADLATERGTDRAAQPPHEATS
ncbi:antitoxin [Terrabacter sp. GCM10028922]|uniref:antitoxin n=1 Tax=Terrabacter sp. GCM10028922 TaxID=3273428 RepID=UPI00361938A7